MLPVLWTGFTFFFFAVRSVRPYYQLSGSRKASSSLLLVLVYCVRRMPRASAQCLVASDREVSDGRHMSQTQ